jgi:hypothetical protein
LYSTLIFPMHATCCAHLILLDLVVKNNLFWLIATCYSLAGLFQ